MKPIAKLTIMSPTYFQFPFIQAIGNSHFIYTQSGVYPSLGLFCAFYSLTHLGISVLFHLDVHKWYATKMIWCFVTYLPSKLMCRRRFLSKVQHVPWFQCETFCQYNDTSDSCTLIRSKDNIAMLNFRWFPSKPCDPNSDVCSVIWRTAVLLYEPPKVWPYPVPVISFWQHSIHKKVDIADEISPYRAATCIAMHLARQNSNCNLVYQDWQQVWITHDLDSAVLLLQSFVVHRCFQTSSAVWRMNMSMFVTLILSSAILSSTLALR